MDDTMEPSVPGDLPPTGSTDLAAASSTLFPKVLKVSNALSELRKHRPDLFVPNGKCIVTATVKLHGAHADILVNPDDTIKFQSRNQADLIAAGNEIFGFTTAMLKVIPNILALRDQTVSCLASLRGREFTTTPTCLLSGEWIGKDIQKGMAISQMEKAFVLYDAKVDGERVDDFRDFAGICDTSARILNIYSGGSYQREFRLGSEAEIEASCQELQSLADLVIRNCPFGTAHSQIGFGEGIVCKFLDGLAGCTSSRYWFKVKEVPKKSRKPIPPTNSTELCTYAKSLVTQERLDKARMYLLEIGLLEGDEARDRFCDWIRDDIAVEERLELEALGMMSDKDFWASIYAEASRGFELFKQEVSRLGLEGSMFALDLAPNDWLVQGPG